MGEQTILVCDVCGRPAVETATIRVGARNYVKDYCAQHLSELIAGGRAPRRGRRRSVAGAGSATRTTAPKRRGRPPKSAATKRSTRKAATKKSTGRRRGRPRKAQTSS